MYSQDRDTPARCASTLTVMVAARYYKLAINEEELIEIDAVNLVRKVGGVDQMEAIRTAIGL